MIHPLRILVFACLLIPAIGIVVFGPRPQQDVPQHRVVVEYWEKWSGREGAVMEKIINEFNNTIGKEKNIYVRYLSTSEVDRKTLVAIAAGVPPDIAGMWDNTLSQYAALDALEPLDDLAREAGITEQTYKPVYWRACHYGDHLYALVSTPGVVALLYNRVAFEQNADVLRAHGLDPNRAPRTIAELDQYAAALDKKDANGRIERVGYLPQEPGWYLYYMPFWFGGNIWDYKTQKITLDAPPVIAAYDWLASYARKLGPKEGLAFFSTSGSGSNWDSPQNPFINGTILMEQNGPWMADRFEDYCPDRQRLLWSKEVEMTKPLAERKKNYFWAVAPFPSAVPGLEDVSYCTSDVLVIPRGAKHKREAFTFMAYLNRQEVMERLCSAQCKNSPLADVSADFIEHHRNPYIDVFERLAASPNACSMPPIPIFQVVHDELDVVSQRLALLQTDATTALKEAQSRVDAKYSDFLQMQQKRRLAPEPVAATPASPLSAMNANGDAGVAVTQGKEPIAELKN
jgi:multiple sugar transport system substrate-binding protein